MMFKCENCGTVFNKNIMDWKELRDVRCPSCGSRCVRRIFQESVLW